MLEEDENIDHIFVTQHTPAFPNGGHVQGMICGMEARMITDHIFPAEKPLPKGIIERRE